VIDPAREQSLGNMLPADAAAGKVDYLEVVGFSDHKATAAIWYRLLNLGFRIPAGAGTDAMANYASLRGPVGMNRVFLDTRGETSPQALRDALKAGRSFASNGPLLGLILDGARPGDALARAGPGSTRYRIALRSPVPVDHLELVHNGRVVRSFRLAGDRRTLDAEGSIAIEAGGWILLRARRARGRSLFRGVDGARAQRGARARRLQYRTRAALHDRLPRTGAGALSGPRGRSIAPCRRR
jgi:hypothetical protein